MHHQLRALPTTCAVLAAMAALALSACAGGTRDQAKALLKQTFSASHRVNSGKLSLVVMVNPSGSRTLTVPIGLSFGGRFQSLGTGELPATSFTVTLSGLGRTGSLGLLSTGQDGFVSLEGASYQLPAAVFHRLESTFAGLTSSTTSASGSGALAKLGIDPLRWLTNPSLAGTETIAGATTTHIRAGVNVTALLADLDTFLRKASAAGVGGAGRIAAQLAFSTRSRIARQVQNPRFDVWTGKADKTPRRIALELTLPVSGRLSMLLGGLRSADIALSVQYSDLNQPQAISAPATVRPFTEFSAKLRALTPALPGILSGALGAEGTGASPGASGVSG